MNLSRIEGIVSNLDRSTHVSGGGDHQTSTTHLHIFEIPGHRVLLRSKSPAMIVNGDSVRLTGRAQPGEFTALACKNLSTGWTTTFRPQGCAISALSVITALTIPFAFLFPPALLPTGVFAFLLYRILAHDHQLHRAHSLLA